MWLVNMHDPQFLILINKGLKLFSQSNQFCLKIPTNIKSYLEDENLPFHKYLLKFVEIFINSNIQFDVLCLEKSSKTIQCKIQYNKEHTALETYFLELTQPLHADVFVSLSCPTSL